MLPVRPSTLATMHPTASIVRICRSLPSGLPDNATILSVILKICKAGGSSVSPYATLGNIMVDVRTGPFSGNPALQAGDFQATASKNSILSIPNTAAGAWYFRALSATYFGYINKTGITQFRLRFSGDDNNNRIADYLTFYSGNSVPTTTYNYRPALVIKYSVP